MGILGVVAQVRPEPDPARDLLRHELTHPEYHRQSLLERLVDWLREQFDRLTAAAAGASPLSTFAAILVGLAVVGLLVYVVPRLRRDVPVPRASGGGVLGDEEATADHLRARAESALAGGQLELAVIDGYRALARRTLERGVVEATPGSTAHEIAESLERRFPGHRARLGVAADLFDAVLYGEQHAVAADAREVLSLDDDLQRAEPADDLASAARPRAVPR